MPATEQTWRDQKKLHVVFAVSSVIMLFSTMWMFTRDSDRPWKDYQRTMREIDLRMTTWRNDQFSSADYIAEHTALQEVLVETRRMPFDKASIEQIKSSMVVAARQDNELDEPTFDSLDKLLKEHASLAKKAAKAAKARAEADAAAETLRDTLAALQASLEEAEAKADSAAEADVEATKQAAKDLAARVKATAFKKKAADAKLENAERTATDTALEVGPVRDEVVALVESYIKDAKFRESVALQERKFKSADLDKLKADLGLGVSAGLDDATMSERQLAVDETNAELDTLTLTYQARQTHRKKLVSLLATLTEAEAAADKKIAEHKASEDRLATSFREKRATWFVMGVLPGKKFLELPILDAFGSPLKIENNWSEGNLQDYNFSKVRRFDRCVTCHQAVQKTMPGSAVKAAYEPEHQIMFTLAAGEPLDDSYEDDEDLDALEQQVNRVRAIYGLNLADQGLINPDDVTIRYVRPQSIAAGATAFSADVETPVLPEVFVAEVLEHTTANDKSEIGLLPGDVIAEINGDRVSDVRQAAFQFLDAADEGRTLTLTVRRGLPQPYTSHPRLDLFVGSLSPHKLADFACTVCHEGQGSATDFTWASHTPQNPQQQEEWRKKYGWFDNHHWIYPMASKQFHQSSCLKCHHEVVELEPSEKFAEAPAPKLMHGYNLIRKYGCYGCHEVNGYDGPERVGPDLRAEPNYYSAAQSLQVDPGYEKLTDRERDWIETLIFKPEQDAVRRKLVTRLKADTEPEATRRLSDHAYDILLPVLGDLEYPGELTKPGPSLRFVGTKLDAAFLYNWIWNPKDFRPTTRMPRFLGLWDHLKDDHKSLAVAEKFEPMEAYAMGYYLKTKSQPFEYLEPPTGISESTVDERAARGKVLLEERGCLACHSHNEFPDIAKYRDKNEIQQGPDLSGIGDKFDPQRNPNGRKWLYSWIKKPNRYHVRTVMPDLYLNPIPHKDVEGNVTSTTDPADDITEFLMQSKGDWTPSGAITELNEKQAGELTELAMEHLTDAFSIRQAEDLMKSGIPREMESGLKGAEKELLVDDTDGTLSLDLKLKYVGRKTISKYGCFGCHDIPGFEDAKPIGTGLADWARKEPAKLAFEHIAEYLAHGHSGGHAKNGHGKNGHGKNGHGKNGHDKDAHEGHDDESDDHAHGEMSRAESDPMPPFYQAQLDAHNRIGFLYQKLREPRGYDYHKTLNKSFNERLRMPEFPFTVEEREAVMTFVLGLVADPPTDKYIYKPDPRMQAIIEGRKVLQKYNCGGCHILEAEKWEIAFGAEDRGPQARNAIYPFAAHDFSEAELKASGEVNVNNRVTATLVGMPALDDLGYARVYDLEDEPLYEEDTYTSQDVQYFFDIWKPVAINGHDYQVGESAMMIPGYQVSKRHPTRGGLLAKYLIPRVVAREKLVNPNAKGAESWGWVPPPLVGQGAKTQTEWLHSFLMNPHPIRPSVVLRMPNFAMTSDEARSLVNYFSAIEDVEYPYVHNERRQPQYLERKEADYRSLLAEANVAIENDGVDHRFTDAMKMITSSNYCVKCHIIGDYVPSGADRAKAPNLGIIYKRLRPDYVRQWIGKPTSILPYTSMPVNVPYNPDVEFLGSNVPQDLYHGTSIDQVDAFVDLLMNYDLYAKQRSTVLDLVEAGKAAPPVEGAPTDGTATPGTGTPGTGTTGTGTTGTGTTGTGTTGTGTTGTGTTETADD